MNLRASPGLLMFGLGPVLAVTIACGNIDTGSGSLPVSGASTLALHVDLPEVNPSDQVPHSHDLAPEVLAKVRATAFRITGLECIRAQFGTAFVVEEGVLVTNAHVVAGNRAPRVFLKDREIPARVVAFDPVADLAVLAVDERLPEPLALADAIPGTVVALLGYDHAGSLSVRPARIDQEILATGMDIYGERARGRQALIVNAWVETGFSGGPVVDSSGRVVGVVFSRARGGLPVAYAIQVSEVRALLDEAATNPEGSGPCR